MRERQYPMNEGELVHALALFCLLRRLPIETADQHLNPHLRKTANSILANPVNRDYFKLQVKAQLARILYRNNGYYAVQTLGDNVIQKAMQMLYNKKYLALISR